MDRICRYSTIIFAGNVATLVIVALTTDYWEYRSCSFRLFNHTLLEMGANMRTKVKMHKPPDWEYFIVEYSDTARKKWSPQLPQAADSVVVQPPIVLYRFNKTKSHMQRLHHNADEENEVEVKDILLVYTQYGNLFRDCDDLGIGQLAPINNSAGRCASFLYGQVGESAKLRSDIPEIRSLEAAALVFAALCLLSSLSSVVCGARGLIQNLNNYKIAASSFALASSVSLTITIALFHGKCHLMHRRGWLNDVDTPLKNVVNKSRHFQFGWSFVLAWISIVLCFVQSWVWLLKAQSSNDVMRRKSRANARLIEAFREFDSTINDLDEM